jgi:hypothetical protein
VEVRHGALEELRGLARIQVDQDERSRREVEHHRVVASGSNDVPCADFEVVAAPGQAKEGGSTLAEEVLDRRAALRCAATDATISAHDVAFEPRSQERRVAGCCRSRAGGGDCRLRGRGGDPLSCDPQRAGQLAGVAAGENQQED